MHSRFFKKFTNPLNKKSFYETVRKKQEKRTSKIEKRVKGILPPSNKRLWEMIKKEWSELRTAEKMKGLKGIEYAEKKGSIISEESGKRLKLLVRELSSRTNIPEEEIMKMVRKGKKPEIRNKPLRVQMAKRL